MPGSTKIGKELMEQLQDTFKSQLGNETRKALGDDAPKTPEDYVREIFERMHTIIEREDIKNVLNHDVKWFGIKDFDEETVNSIIDKAIENARYQQNKELNKKYFPGIFPLRVVDGVDYSEKAYYSARDRLAEDELNGPEGHNSMPWINNYNRSRHTREGFDIAKEANASVPRDYIEKALSRKFTHGEIKKGIEEGDDLNGPENSLSPATQPKPGGNRARLQSKAQEHANPFDVRKSNLKQQAELLERNPLHARQLIIAAGRDPEQFGFA